MNINNNKIFYPINIKNNLSGKRYGKLLVLKLMGMDYRGYIYYKCECDCGKIKNIIGNNLARGYTNSCGCIKLKHKMTNTRLYKIWTSMNNRCRNVNNHKPYKNYSLKGIIVCDEWKKDFLYFYNWSIKNGYNDKLEIDRKNNNEGYSPENCKWATRLEQNNNTRSNRLITYNGEIHTMAEWSRIKNIDYIILFKRIKNNFPIDKLFEPNN